MSDDLDDFIEFDMTMGADAVKCPHCGATVSRSLLEDGEIKCPKCEDIIVEE